MPSFQPFLEKSNRVYSQLNNTQRLYLGALISTIALITLWPLLTSTDRKVLAPCVLTYLVFVVVRDLLALYRMIYQTILGKALFLLLFSASTTLALAVSAQYVNNSVGVDPSLFPHTLAILSILSIPGFLALACILVYTPLAVLTSFVFWLFLLPDDISKSFYPHHMNGKEIVYPKATFIVKWFCTLLVAAVAVGLFRRALPSYESFLAKAAPYLVYTFEMYSKAPCPIEEGSKVAFLKDGWVLIGTEGEESPTFTLKECKPSRS